MRQRGVAFGPVEPIHTRIARQAYYRRRDWLLDLEERIASTDGGMEWLMRVKRIGRP